MRVHICLKSEREREREEVAFIAVFSLCFSYAVSEKAGSL
jgi:hypothetical protein